MSIGQGNIFNRSPEALELFWYVLTHFNVVLEYDDSETRHY